MISKKYLFQVIVICILTFFANLVRAQPKYYNHNFNQFVLVLEDHRQDLRRVKTQTDEDQANPYFLPRVPSEWLYWHPSPPNVVVW